MERGIEKKFLLLVGGFILVSFLIGFTSAASYYVTSSGSGSTCSQSAPCSFSTAQTSANAGDTIYFRNTDTWTASSGTAVLVPKGGVSYIGDEWGTGTRATLRGSTGLSRAVVYFGSDHATYPTVVKGFHVDGNSATLDLISICHDGSCYSDLTGATKRIENCVAHDTGAGDYYYGIIVAPNRGTTVSNVEIINNEVYRTSWSAITVYPYYVGATNSIHDVVIRGNYVHDTLGDQGSHGIMMCGDNVDNVMIEYNYIRNAFDYGLEFCRKTSQAMTNIVARYNIVEQSKRSFDFYKSNSGDNYDVTLYGNIFRNNNDGGRFSSGLTGLNVALRIYNNVFYNNGGSAEIYMDQDPVFSVFEIKNNVFYSSNPAYLDSSGANEITSHSDNIYYRSGGGTLVQTGGTSYTSSNLASFESSASSSNPNFKNTNNLPTGFVGTYGVDLRPNNDGLSITSGFAIDGGVSLGSQYSGSINSVTRPQGGGWDIGAYEYTSGSQTDTTPPSRSAGSPSGILSSGTTQTTISLTATDSSGVSGCRYSTTAGTSYASMSNSMTGSGGTYSATISGLTNGNSYNYYVRCIDSLGNANTNDFTISFSVASPASVFSPDQYIEAEQGVLTSPMQSVPDATASGGAYVSTSTGYSGSVSFTFNIATAGDYKMDARVLSSSDAVNSFYVGLDSEAADGNDYYTWDTEILTSFGWDNVSRRGSGGNSSMADFDPMVWSLSSGEHTFTFYGREANVWLDQVILRSASSSASSCSSGADSSGDSVVSIGELINFISAWKSGSVTISDLITAIGEWKNGC